MDHYAVPADSHGRFIWSVAGAQLKFFATDFQGLFPVFPTNRMSCTSDGDTRRVATTLCDKITRGRSGEALS
ncbi:MAG: hypothetical protein JWR22_2857 [Herminiimonas sp.]|nr:hypothetical protein [Herminiimonas sp.]